jgi:hypothetical protein
MIFHTRKHHSHALLSHDNFQDPSLHRACGTTLQRLAISTAYLGHGRVLCLPTWNGPSRTRRSKASQSFGVDGKYLFLALTALRCGRQFRVRLPLQGAAADLGCGRSVEGAVK